MTARTVIAVLTVLLLAGQPYCACAAGTGNGAPDETVVDCHGTAAMADAVSTGHGAHHAGESCTDCTSVAAADGIKPTGGLTVELPEPQAALQSAPATIEPSVTVRRRDAAPATAPLPATTPVSLYQVLNH